MRKFKLTKKLLWTSFFIWIFLCIIAFPHPSLGLYYSITYIDKIIHFFCGIFVAVFFLYFGFKKINTLGLNILIAILWEFGQIITSHYFPIVGIGFPDGYTDIAVHILGTSLILFFYNRKYS